MAHITITGYEDTAKVPPDRLSPAQHWYRCLMVEESRARLAAGGRTYSLDEVKAYLDAGIPLVEEAIYVRLRALCRAERAAYINAKQAGDDAAAERHDWRWAGLQMAFGAVRGVAEFDAMTEEQRAEVRAAWKAGGHR